jgi:hypothetical protein
MGPVKEPEREKILANGPRKSPEIVSRLDAIIEIAEGESQAIRPSQTLFQEYLFGLTASVRDAR